MFTNSRKIRTGSYKGAGFLQGNIQIYGIDLDRPAPGMGGLGKYRDGETALDQILHDAAGIANGGVQTLRQFLGCEFVRAPVVQDSQNFLDVGNGQGSLPGNVAELQAEGLGDHSGALGIHRANEMTVGIHDKGRFLKLCFPGSDLNIIHGMGDGGTDAIGGKKRGCMFFFQHGPDLADMEFIGEETDNLHGGNHGAAGFTALNYTVDQVCL